MFLEMHDRTPPTLCAVARNIDYMYQAEQHVIDSQDRAYLILWLLFSDGGTPLRAWRRTHDAFEEIPIPDGTAADPRSLMAKGSGS